MAYYRVCPDCGCNLDPNEKCDCIKEKTKMQDFFNSYLKLEPETSQLVFAFKSMEVGDERKNYS